MKLIIHDYYKFNLRCNIIIFLLEYKRRIFVNKDELIREGNNATFNLESFQYCKYRINLSSFKNVYYEILLNDKSLLYEKTSICYFDFIDKNTINILTKEEYNKNEQMIKKNRHDSVIKFWHLYWNCLHWITYSYPENPTSEDKQQIINLVNKMRKNGITCSYCRNHFNKWCTDNDINKFLDKRDDLISFFINVHNDVNKRNEKKILSREEVDQIYLKFKYSKLLKYGLDVMTLFNKRTLDKLPDIINSYTKHILLDEFKIITFA
jgi:hypothetical protein